jgi:hypothetical protein
MYKQQRTLTYATRKALGHAFYRKQAMEEKNLPVVLDSAARIIVGESGGPIHGQYHNHHSSSSNNPASATNDCVSTAMFNSLLRHINSGLFSRLDYDLYM